MAKPSNKVTDAYKGRRYTSKIMRFVKGSPLDEAIANYGGSINYLVNCLLSAHFGADSWLSENTFMKNSVTQKKKQKNRVDIH